MSRSNESERPTVGYDAEVIELAAWCDRLASHHHRVALDVIRRAGAPETVAGLLWLLAGDGNDHKMSQIATELDCDPSNVTLLAAHLERLDLAQRVPDPSDRRQRLLRLTGPGTQLAGDMLRAVALASPFSALGAEQRAHLRALLAP